MNTSVMTGAAGKAKWALPLPLPPKRRLRDEFSDWLRTRNYRPATISAYVSCVLDFVVASGKRDPRAEWDRRGESGKVGGGETERSIKSFRV
jgi:hypothetical protein